ncbi:MAG TPA: hypothetical protein VKA07_11795 [Candidatus Sulfotelmatobacter sp.]|nr:hypothetical protein [Candidatus Sulfotelmatobacter sp.]
MKRWILRPLAWLLGGVTLVVVLLAGAIRLDQFTLRWRAQRLLSDIRSLELRKSTYADVRRFEGRWLDNAKEGICRPYWCDLEVQLYNASSRHFSFLVSHPAVFAIYHALGGRFAGVYSFIRIRDNLLLEKGISLGIESTSIEPDGRHIDYELVARIETDPLTWVSARHPEYQIGAPDGCMGCKEGWVKFTSFADPKDVLRLTDINFTCITRWRPCSGQEDILPKAWKELQAEKTDVADAFDVCTPPVIRVLSREARRVVLAKIIGLAHNADGAVVTVRRMPNGVSQHADEWQENTFTVRAISDIHIGSQLLVFDDARCPAVQATEENLGAARLGASEGMVSPVHSLGLPFGTFNPPKIEVR